MGYYIQVPRNYGKADQLVTLHGAEIVSKPKSFSDIPDGKGLICVVDNRAFEAAAFCYSEREMQEFAEHDGRPRTWLLMDLGKAKNLSGFV